MHTAQEVQEVQARHVVLATGASAQALQASGMSERTSPSAMGLRGYVKNLAMVDRLCHMEVAWHPKLKPGYGWIFPCPDGVFNIGVGIIDSHRPHDHTMREINLRHGDLANMGFAAAANLPALLIGDIHRGGVIAAIFAFAIAAFPQPDGSHYWIAIMVPGTIVGLLVGYATQKYGTRAAPR